MFFLLVLSGYFSIGQSDKLLLLSKVRTSSLETYISYASAIINSFQVPENTILASFKFYAYEQDLSIFGCSFRNVSLHLKHGSPPLVNPDGSKVPSEIKNITRPETYSLDFLSNRSEVFINITSPDPGIYYSISFLSYADPRFRPISQQGLRQSCNAYIEASLYTKEAENPTVIAENQLVNLIFNGTVLKSIRFYVAENEDHCLLYVTSLTSLTKILVTGQARKPPSDKIYSIKEEVNNKTTLFLWAFPDSWYYLYFSSINRESVQAELTFHVTCFDNRFSLNYLNESLNNISITTRLLRSSDPREVQPYKQYSLSKNLYSDIFMFSFELEREIRQKKVIPINITNHYFSVLKFRLLDGHDIGGSLQYTLSFPPQFNKSKTARVVGCIQQNSIAIPTWPESCVSSGITSKSDLVLNATVSNLTILIPYPEGETWYASFKLFCGSCEPCNCSNNCIQKYKNSVMNCEAQCLWPSDKNCEHCFTQSKQTLEDCADCNCDGPCKTSETDYCNSSIIFDVSSRSCYHNGCGRNGRCILMVSDGIVFSSCMCSNNYRGFDCSDDTLATPYYMVVIEFLLLVLSNVVFLPSTYIAVKRKYYVEALSYFFVFLFSSLYHMCDSGENILTFCIVNLNTLQFADFFMALLSIWLTLLAIADLPPISSSLLQVGGCTIISFLVTLNRLAVWVFLLPTCLGCGIIAVNWFLKYWKFRQNFIEKKYLRIMAPLGLFTVIFGLVIFSLLQTESNYKYLHSLWHILMAVGIMLLLPNRKTFQVHTLLQVGL